MWRCGVSCLLIGVLCGAGAWTSPAAAADVLGWLTRQSAGPAPSPATSTGRAPAVPPGKQRYYAYNVDGYPWYSHGCAVPTFNWGYFGAEYRPTAIMQHGYFNDYRQYGFRPGD
jgi:hypothetical protein